MREDISKISCPSTLKEARDILPKLKEWFGNGEEYSFDINQQDEDSLTNISVLCDADNDTITIFQFFWTEGIGYERAVDGVSSIHLSTKEAKRMADMINYFVRIIENEQ